MKGEVKDGFRESWPDAYEREVVVYVPNVLTTFVTHFKYSTSVNFVVKSAWVLCHYFQLIVTVRSSAPPRNPPSDVADDLSGEDSGSLNDDTRQILKVCLLHTFML